MPGSHDTLREDEVEEVEEEDTGCSEDSSCDEEAGAQGIFALGYA